MKPIGQGSFGCIYRPSLRCASTGSSHPPSTYENKVSKVVKQKNEQDEMFGHELMDDIDPTFKFHFPRPHLCDPNTDPITVAKLENCSILRPSHVPRLLIMDDGGVSLLSFCNDSLDTYLAPSPVKHTWMFWNAARNLLEAVHELREHGVVHNDIKPANIVFDPRITSFKLIDFGLTTTSEAIWDDAKNNTYDRAQFYFAYPSECALMTWKRFNKYIELHPVVRWNDPANKFRKGLRNNIKTQIWYRTGNEPTSTEVVAPADAFMREFIDMIRTFSSEPDINATDVFTSLIMDLIQIIDVFGVGLSLQFALVNFIQAGTIQTKQSESMSLLFNHMCSISPLMRISDTAHLLEKYDMFMLTMPKEG